MTRKRSIEATAQYKCGHMVTVRNITPAQGVEWKRNARTTRCPVCQAEAERHPFRLVTLDGKPKGE